MTSGMDDGRLRPTMAKYGEVGQHGGHTPANKLTETSLQTGSRRRLKKKLGEQNEPTSAKLKSSESEVIEAGRGSL